MKKFNLLFLLVLVLIAFSQCKKDDDDKQNNVNVQDYFSVSNAEYIDGKLIASSNSNEAPIIDNVTGNASIINGGSNILQVYSNSDDIKSIIVSKKGVRGYFKLPVDYNNKGSFQVLLVFNSELPEDEFEITVAVIDAQSLVSSYYEIPVRRIEHVGAGILQFSMSFDLLNDIDLHVEQPDGVEIYYGNPGGYNYDDIINDVYEQLTQEQLDSLFSFDSDLDAYDYLSQFIDLEPYKLSGGWLDVDSNAGCSLDSINNENINYTYESDIIPGEYVVRVDFFSDCNGDDELTNYMVTAKLNGEVIGASNLISGSNPYNGSFEANTDDGGGLGDGVEIMRVNIGDEFAKLYNDKPSYEFVFNNKNEQVDKKIELKPQFRLNHWLKKNK